VTSDDNPDLPPEAARHNPYAPPKAAVAEAEIPIPRPAAVITAMQLLWVSFALTFVEVALDWEAMTEGEPLIFAIFAALGIAVTLWLYFNIWAGRNWARITYLVLTAISIPLLVIDLPDNAQRAPLAAGLALIDLFLVFYALYLLFFPGREWFRAHTE
jgi:hypothetical protein